MIEVALYDTELKPLTILSLDWNPLKQGTTAAFPFVESFANFDMRGPTEALKEISLVETKVMRIHFIELRRNGITGWAAMTDTPQHLAAFMKTRRL